MGEREREREKVLVFGFVLFGVQFGLICSGLVWLGSLWFGGGLSFCLVGDFCGV